MSGALANRRNSSDNEQVVFVIDDDAQLRMSLVDLFQSVDITAVPFEDPADFIDRGELDRPGCILLDMRMPGANGIDFQRTLQELGCTLPIVFITGHGDIPMTVTAMKAGAVDFILKPFGNETILRAVESAFAKDTEQRGAFGNENHVRSLWSRLTGREKQVMELVTQGLMNKQVAYALGLSEIMVKMHRGRVMRKMKATSFADLVRKNDLIKDRGPFGAEFAPETAEKVAELRR
jgi:FixJ family two-component response regulator